MKKTGRKIIFGLVTMGMLAVTGASAIVGEIPAEKIETVEYKMEKNDSSLVSGPYDLKWTYDRNKKGQYVTTFDEAINIYITFRQRYALVNIKGYDKPVLIRAMEEDRRDNLTYNVQVYTEQGKNKPLKMVGELESDFPITMKDGVIYANSSRSYETYVVSSDGKRLVPKDYINFNGWSGYTNSSGAESTRVSYKGDAIKVSNLWKSTYEKSHLINFVPGKGNA
ncbi:hypothetical protein [Butyrivibrio sp. INlla21]|uniref:hypothetical protein n=1 Tax=Butyrivibrio sp. INlla21 TaxID=1520811 RepID=UPI0008E734C6|nr:hypothetical protein [Butyrivibrio sp. INlla21]SFU91162.1 hypothetical protein SAMN02910342_02351 [Butyrivibrio sp. INlla21]